MFAQRKKIIIPLLLALIGFLSATRSPRFELLHTVDVLQLLATGMCLGVALTNIMRGLRGQP